MAGVTMKQALRWIAGGLLTLAPPALLAWLGGDTWLAMPPLLAVFALAAAWGAGVIATVVFWGLTVGQLIMITAMVYGMVSAQSAARKAARNAKNAYNASLTDRTTSIMSADAPWQIIYGEAVVGGAVVAILTSGDKDQYKHVVVVWAAHECTAIPDFMLAGVSVGALDSEGYPIGGKWLKAGTETLTHSATFSEVGTLTLPTAYAARYMAAPTRILVITDALANESASMIGASEVTLADHTITLNSEQMAFWAGRAVVVTYDNGMGNALIRVRHYLGSQTQTADGPTMADCPGDWTASDRGQGLCYSIIRFDLNEPEFQGGPMAMTARVKGRKVLDHRTGATAWSDNVSRCTADFLQAEWGKQALSAHMDWASFDATANVCDEALASQGGAKRFTCNGAFRTDSSPDSTLDQLCQAMGGFVTQGAGYHLQAGAYAAPVMALTDADNRGSIEIVAAPQGTEVFNGLRGQFFDPARFDQLTDYPPYQNAAFVSEDGGALWSDLALPFTNTAWRAHNLARIQVERSRGMQLVYPAKRRALGLRVGQRVRLTNALLGFEASVFRVVKRSYKLGGAVELSLAQDDASYYDEVDAPASLASPAVRLKDPFVVGPVAGLLAASGTATLLLLGDGTILSRIKVAVTASTDALVTANGALQIEYRRDRDAVWQRAPDAGGAGTVAYLLGLEEGFVYIVRARWRNGLGAVGDWRSRAVLHLGKLEVPAAVVGFGLSIVPGAMKGARTPSVEADYARTLYRYGASFSAGTPVPGTADASGFVWPSPAAGTYTVWAADVDHSGNLGPAVSQTITVSPSDVLANVSTVVLVNDGGMLIVGNSAEKVTASENWDAAVRSRDGYTGGAFVSFVPALAGKRLGMGLDTDPAANASYVTMRAWLYVEADSTMYAYENNVGHGPLGTWAPGDVLGVSYDGTAFRYYRNGALLRTTPAAVTAPLYLDSSFYTLGAKVTNIQFGPLSSNAWASIGGRPKNYRVGAVGLNAASASPPIGAKLYDADTGAVLVHGAAMYRVVKINRASNAVTDVGGWNTLAGGSNPADMATALNAIASDHFVVVFSYGEPQGNRFTGGLLEAMLRHGASRAVFGSPQFRYRSAYVLVAIGGCGEGNGAECYAGATDSDTNAWCELGFQTHNGSLTVSGTTSGARTLTDFGYTGDLNATNNEVVYSPSAPGSPSDRTIWIDTSVTPRTIKIRIGGSWVLAGTYVNGTAQITDDANLGLTALWSGIPGGSGKAADYATRNPVYYTDTDPGSVPDGSIWISSTKAWQRVGGAWRAYVGAGSVDTGELANASATRVVIFEDAAGVSRGGGTSA